MGKVLGSFSYQHSPFPIPGRPNVVTFSSLLTALSWHPAVFCDLPRGIGHAILRASTVLFFRVAAADRRPGEEAADNSYPPFDVRIPCSILTIASFRACCVAQQPLSRFHLCGRFWQRVPPGGMEFLLAPACATEQFCRREESELGSPASDDPGGPNLHQRSKAPKWQV